MAITGENGDNETYIGLSKSISYNIYDESKNEIPIKNLKNKIEYSIPKDLPVQIIPYTFIDTTNLLKNNFSNNNITGRAYIANNTFKFFDGIFTSGFRLNGSNVSVHIQIKPDDKYKLNFCYLFLLKFKSNPVFNLNTQDFDEWSIFCPKGKQNFLHFIKP